MLKPCLAALIALAAAAAGSPVAAAVTCEGLPAVALDSARVTAAVMVPGPTFTAPDGVTYNNIKPFCKVSVVATPTPDSLINIEAWLPAESHWNWRLQGVGNGGYAGNLAGPAPAMVIGMRKGFAVVSTDMGTAPGANSNADVLVGHPQKWEDWGHRATHVMTIIGKQLVAAHYDRAPQYSYFNGCSTGGQQALMLAQRYPGHYDGILAGAPAHNRTHLHTSVVWNWQAMRATPASMITSDHAKLITTEVTKACAAKSGGLAGDAYLTDPRSCDWDPGVLQCPAGAAGTNCLSADQVTAARKIYRGAHNPVTGARIISASTRGAEADTQFGWYPQARNSDPPFASLFKWVFGLTWSAASYDFNAHMASVDQLLAPILNATSADLSAFRARGGKLMLYTGTADPIVPFQDTVNYYHRVVNAQQGGWNHGLAQTRQFFRFFAVPGMAHCAGGPGPNAFGNLFSGLVVAPEAPSSEPSHDAMAALQQWVEGGVAPERLVATKYEQDQVGGAILAQRPICAYPKFPKYSGQGPAQAEASYVCVDNGNAVNPALNPMPAPEYLR